MYRHAMNFGLGEEVDALRDMVRRFAEDRIAPLAAAIDRDNTFPAPLWKEMGELIDDDMLATFAVVAEPDRLAEGLLDRYAGSVDRLSFYAPAAADPTAFDQVRAELRAA